MLGLKQESADEKGPGVVLGDESTGPTSSTMRAAQNYMILFGSIRSHAILDSQL